MGSNQSEYHFLHPEKQRKHMRKKTVLLNAKLIGTSFGNLMSSMVQRGGEENHWLLWWGLGYCINVHVVNLINHKGDGLE